MEKQVEAQGEIVETSNTSLYFGVKISFRNLSKRLDQVSNGLSVCKGVTLSQRPNSWIAGTKHESYMEV